MGDISYQNDSHLIDGCLRKDLEAWSQFVKKYSKLVQISISNRLRKYGLPSRVSDIEDIKQNIFSDIWKNSLLASVAGRDDISHWVAMVSGNAAIDYFRAKGARQAMKSVSLSDKVGEHELTDILPSGAAKPGEELARAELSARIDEAVESLPEKEKIVIKLYLVHEKKYHEVAGTLNMPIGTVKSYIKRARERLAAALKEH